MPKYNYKLKKRRIRYTKPYVCMKPPFVTNWSGILLNKEARQEIRVNDTIRIQTHEYGTCYVTIKRIHNDRMIGILDDPYYHQEAFCNICNYLLDYSQKNYWIEIKEYHVCDKCYKCYQKDKSEFTEYKHPNFRQGTIVRFKRNDISEIPDWTNNTRKIGNKYRNKNNMGRLMTGSF